MIEDKLTESVFKCALDKKRKKDFFETRNFYKLLNALRSYDGPVFDDEDLGSGLITINGLTRYRFKLLCDSVLYSLEQNISRPDENHEEVEYGGFIFGSFNGRRIGECNYFRRCQSCHE